MYNFSMLLDDNTCTNLEGKIKVFNKFHINNIEINDCIDGKKITELNGEEIEKIRNVLIQYNKKIVLLSCNTDVSYYEYYKTVFRQAHTLGVENVKVGIDLDCCCYDDTSSCAGRCCSDDTENSCFQKLAMHLKKIIKLGESYGIGVLMENNSSVSFTHDIEFTGISKEFGLEGIQLVFNPLEYVRLKKHPFFHVFYNSKLKSSILFLRINDGLYVDGSPTFPGEGNAEVKEMASAMLARGFKGYFSFSPYFGSNMDIEQQAEIIDKFKALLMKM